MEIVSALDHVNELYIVMAGHVELVPPSSLIPAAGSSSSSGGAYTSAPSTTYGPGGDSLVAETRPYRVANIRQTAGGGSTTAAAAPAAAAGGGESSSLVNGPAQHTGWSLIGTAADGAARQQSYPGGDRLANDLSRAYLSTCEVL